MALTVEDVSIIILVIITAIYLIVTALILLENKKQRVQDKESTRQIISETRNQRFQDKHLTREILHSARLQRLQDAELSTILQEVDVTYSGHKIKIDVTFAGKFPIRNWKFFIKDSKGNEKECKSSIINEWTTERWEIRLFVDLDTMGSPSIRTVNVNQKFKIYLTIMFESFLGNNWVYKFESTDLMIQIGPKLKYAGEKPINVGQDPDWFRLVDVIPPWDFKKTKGK